MQGLFSDPAFLAGMGLLSSNAPSLTPQNPMGSVMNNLAMGQNMRMRQQQVSAQQKQAEAMNKWRDAQLQQMNSQQGQRAALTDRVKMMIQNGQIPRKDAELALADPVGYITNAQKAAFSSKSQVVGQGASLVDANGNVIYQSQKDRAPLVEINNGNAFPGLGKLSPDYGYVLDESGRPVIDPQTGLPKSAVIPGSKTDMDMKAEELAKEKRADVRTVSDAEKADATLSATANIRSILESEGLPAAGTASIVPGVISSTNAGRLRSYIGQLQSSVALEAMVRLKEASKTGATGFGQMNQKELQLLLDDIGALDPSKTDPDILLETVNRIENRYKRIKEDIKINVAPEKIKELGLDAIFNDISVPDSQNMNEVPTSPTLKDPLGIR